MRGVITEDGTTSSRKPLLSPPQNPQPCQVLTVLHFFAPEFEVGIVNSSQQEIRDERPWERRDLIAPANERSSVETLRPAASRIISICVSVSALEESSDRRE
ncbi:unnamed protein product [Sphagnum balticum]